MGMPNQRRMGAPFQMGSGGGLVPRGGRRGGSAAFGNSQRFDSATGEDLTQIRPVFGSGGALGNRPRFDPISGNVPPQFMPPAGVGWQGGPPGAGRAPSGPQGGFSGAVQGAMQGIGPGGLQAGPDPTARVQRPVLPQPVEPMGPGDQAPNQYQGMTGSEIFARLFGQRP